MIPYPLWLLPDGRVTSALVKLHFRLGTRVTTHAPWEADKRANCWTKEEARHARTLRRPQQMAIPETWDDRLGN